MLQVDASPDSVSARMMLTIKAATPIINAAILAFRLWAVGVCVLCFMPLMSWQSTRLAIFFGKSKDKVDEQTYAPGVTRWSSPGLSTNKRKFVRQHHNSYF